MKLNLSVMLTGIKMSLSGILAMFFMIFFKLNFGFWAVVTVAAMTCSNDFATFQKGLMRFIGTVVGAIMGYGIALQAENSHFETGILFFLALFIFTFIGLQKNIFSYAGIIAGVTTAIVIGADINSKFLADAALYRTFDVIIGIAITAFVGWLFLNKKQQSQSLKNNMQFTLRISMLFNSFRIAIAATLTYLAYLYLQIPDGFWITISCLFIMEESIDKTHKNALFRFLAHIVACLIGLVAAIICGHHTWQLAAIIGISFFFLGILIAQDSNYSGLGNTIGIALSIILLSGFGKENIVHIAFLRFLTVCIGIGIGLLMTQRFLITSQK